MPGAGYGASGGVQPLIIAVPDTLDNEFVAPPLRRRIPVPGGSGILRERATVHEDLAIARVVLIEDNQQLRSLHPSFHGGQCVNARSAGKDAVCIGIIGRALILDAVSYPRL